MGRGSILVLAVSGIAVCGALATGPGLALATASAAARPADAARPAASAAAPVWGTARPGIAALDEGGVTLGATLSCSSPGNCAVGGSYYGPTVGSGSSAYVADQRNGTRAATDHR